MTTIPVAYEDFLVSIKQEIEYHLGEAYEAELKHIFKNNGIILDAIIIHNEDERVSPTIYLNPYYEKYCGGMELSEIVEDIVELHRQSFEKSHDFGEYLSFEFDRIQQNITFRVIHYDKNKVLLQGIPHIRFLDLAITFHCVIRMDDEGIGSVRITSEHIKHWEVSEHELWELALTNTMRLFPPVLRKMEDVIFDLMNQQDFELNEELMNSENHENSMYVLTNHKGINGAGCILYPDLLEGFFHKIGMDFYILPSSIHEVILVPVRIDAKENDTDRKERLRNMVMEINETQVADEEILADNVYQYTDIVDKLGKFSTSC